MKNEYLDLACAEKAEGMAAYMKNRFVFMGLPKPIRQPLEKKWKQILKPQTVSELKSNVNFLWDQPEREFHMFVLEYLKTNQKLLSPQNLNWLQKIFLKNTWWDSIDLLASNVLGGVLERNTEAQAEMDQWIVHDNFWIRRCALIFQLRYKENTDWLRLQNYILHCIDEKEFFIKKAIGWSLREYAKTNPDKVLQFVHSENRLSPLSKREALKHLK